MPRRPPVALAALALVAACSAGTGDPGNSVAVPPVNGLQPTTLIACRAVTNLLGKDLAKGVSPRPATPTSDTTAAWGDPPITLRCAVPAGSPLDEPYTIDGVMWALHDSGASHTWTTKGRKVNVAVLVPDAYQDQAEIIGTISDAVKTAQL